MPLTPSESKLFEALSKKTDSSPEEAAILDVLKEKACEAGIVMTQPDQRTPKARAFADKVASGTVEEFVLIGVGPNNTFELVVSHFPVTPSYTLTELTDQVATLFKARLQELLKAKLSG